MSLYVLVLNNQWISSPHISTWMPNLYRVTKSLTFSHQLLAISLCLHGRSKQGTRSTTLVWTGPEACKIYQEPVLKVPAGLDEESLLFKNKKWVCEQLSWLNWHRSGILKSALLKHIALRVTSLRIHTADVSDQQ